MIYKHKLGKINTLKSHLGFLVTVLALVAQPLYVAVNNETAVAQSTPEVVYSALHNTVPDTNYDSWGVQAHNFFEFGDRVLLAGSNRDLNTVTFTMSNHGLAETGSSVAWCAANAGACTDAGYTYPITATVYSNDLTSLGSVTQNIFIPWRPAGHPDCGSTSNGTHRGWMKDDVCYDFSALAFNASFDFSASNITLPDEAIFSIAYNTQTRGYAPTGVTGPVDSLNVALRNSTVAPATVGTDQDPDQFYAQYSGAPFQAISWGAPYNLSIQVTATTDSVPPAVQVNLNRESFVNTGVFVNQSKNPEIQASDNRGLDRIEMLREGANTPNVWSANAATSRRANISFQSDGKYTITAYDVAGNVSRPFVINLDGTNPETTLVVPTGIVGNTFTVDGVAEDNMALNRVYVQLVHRESSARYGGTTINLIPQGAGPYEWSRAYNAAELNLPEGTYAAHVSVVDRAGNNSSEGWSDNFKIDRTGPTVNVDATPVEGAAVAGGRVTITGTASSDDFAWYRYQLLDADKNSVTSSIIGGSDSVDADILGEINIDSLPSGALAGQPLPNGTYYVRVWAQDVYGNQTGTKNVPHIAQFVVERPVVEEETETPVDGNNNNGGESVDNGTGSSSANDISDGPSANSQQLTQFDVTPFTTFGTSLGDGLASATPLPADDVSGDDEGEVLGAEDQLGDSAANQLKNGPLKALGILWYWWLTAFALFLATWWVIAAKRRKQEENL